MTLYLKKKVESTDDSGEESDAPAGPSYVTEEVQLNKSDICIMTNACMTDSATLGSLYKPAPAPEKKPISGESTRAASTIEPRPTISSVFDTTGHQNSTTPAPAVRARNRL